MAAVRSGHGRCADLESRLLSGERWIYVDQQSLLKNGRSAVVCDNLAEDHRLEGCTTVAKSCSNHPEPTRCDLVMVERTIQRQALSRPVGTCFASRRSVVGPTADI